MSASRLTKIKTSPHRGSVARAAAFALFLGGCAGQGHEPRWSAAPVDFARGGPMTVGVTASPDLAFPGHELKPRLYATTFHGSRLARQRGTEAGLDDAAVDERDDPICSRRSAI